MGRQLDDSIILVDINDVGYIKWDEVKANVLKESMKGKMSIRQLAEAIANTKGACSHQNIAKLMNAKYDYIAIDTLDSLCSALSVSVKTFAKIYAIAPVESLN